MFLLSTPLGLQNYSFQSEPKSLGDFLDILGEKGSKSFSARNVIHEWNKLLYFVAKAPRPARRGDVSFTHALSLEEVVFKEAALPAGQDGSGAFEMNIPTSLL